MRAMEQSTRFFNRIMKSESEALARFGKRVLNMKKMTGYAGALLLAAAVFAGCSSSPAPASSSQAASSVQASSAVQSQSTGKNSSANSSSQTAESADLVSELVSVSGDDEKAQEAWMKIFQKTADFYQGNVETEGDGEIYEYTTNDDSSFVDNHLIYKDGRENGFMTTSQEVLGADLIDMDNSFNTVIGGSGVITRIANTSTSAVVKLTDTSDDHLKGTVEKIVDGAFTKENYGANNLREATINCGFARTVDPVHDSSLYNYDLQKKGNGYKLTLTVKNLDEYKSKASSPTVITDNVSGARTIGLNEITGETFVFDFDQNGVLEEVGNNIFHAIYVGDEKEYANVRNVTEIDRLDDLDEFQKIIGGFMQDIDSKKLTQGSEFDIEDWQ